MDVIVGFFFWWPPYELENCYYASLELMMFQGIE